MQVYFAVLNINVIWMTVRHVGRGWWSLLVILVGVSDMGKLQFYIFFKRPNQMSDFKQMLNKLSDCSKELIENGIILGFPECLTF